ncbi:MAG: hypothetical protein ACYC1C_15350, partial [Chloroflexota bacterium]
AAPRALGSMAVLAALLTAVLCGVATLPLGFSPAVAAASAFSAAASVMFCSILGSAQSRASWTGYVLLALVYSVLKPAFALFSHDPALGLLAPAVAAGVAAVAGFRLRSGPTFAVGQVAPQVLRNSPVPFLANLDLWLASYWLGPASGAYGLAALFGRPFFMLGAALLPLARWAAFRTSNRRIVAAAIAFPLICAPLGILLLSFAAPFLPGPFATISPVFAAWAILGQSALASFSLLQNTVGTGANWRWAWSLVLLPLALIAPPLAQVVVSLAAIVILFRRFGDLHARLSPVPPQAAAEHT